MYNVLGGYNSLVSGAAFELAPLTANSSSIGNEPSITYAISGVFNLNPDAINSSSIAKTPVISFGQSQIIGNVTVSYAADLYTVTFK